MQDAGIIDNAITFIDKLRDTSINHVTIKFMKKDKSIRLMKATLNFSKIPRIHRPKDVNLPKILKLLKDNGIVHVFDLEKEGWRSVPFQSIEWIETGNKRYRTRPLVEEKNSKEKK